MNRYCCRFKFIFLSKRTLCSKTESVSKATELWNKYNLAKDSVNICTKSSKIDPHAVFCNNELNLSRVHVYGFDYDYTLAIYKRSLNLLIYELAIKRLINDFGYPSELQQISYDPTFAIRGLHFDVENCLLLKLDAFFQIQKSTAYRGRTALSDEALCKIYDGFRVSQHKVDPLFLSKGEMGLKQLVDLFSLPWVGLLSTATEYFDSNKIVFDSQSLFNDVQDAVKAVHLSGEMYRNVSEKLSHYLHKPPGLKLFLQRLYSAGKTLFVVTNSPHTFMNIGMQYLLGADWRKYFKYVVVRARKPSFFTGRAKFRLYDEHEDSFSYSKVLHLEPGLVYAGGNIHELSEMANFNGKGVLYFGDHLFSDLADPMLKLGWNTGAIVPELAGEIRTQNTDEYRKLVLWLEKLTDLIEINQRIAKDDNEAVQVLDQWKEERRIIRCQTKALFNPQFGSIFRTFHNMTHFSRRLLRLSDIYTSQLTNLLQYNLEHQFFTRRCALPHEAHYDIHNVNQLPS